MQGDFSRWTFDPFKQYTRVLSLQGRVFLDADFNEAQELQIAYQRKLTLDLIGPHAGSGTSFEIDNVTATDFLIRAGSYYVAGVRCDTGEVQYSALPALQKPEQMPSTGSFVVYLDVWERLVTYIEDEDRTLAELRQTIREVALGGPDTAARSQVIWQIRFLPAAAGASIPDNKDPSLKVFLAQLAEKGVTRSAPGQIKMRARKPKGADEPCPTDPDARYRGPENQLYRVEIHSGATFPADTATSPKATFKWSRENGSVVFPIRSMEGSTLTLDTLGRDERLGLKEGDLVEVADDTSVLLNTPQPLMHVTSVDPETLLIGLDGTPTIGSDARAHPILRRWEGMGEVKLDPDPKTEGYLPLEQGIEVLFGDGDYRTGDYWMTPARTVTGDVEWPGPADAPVAVPPHGVAHWYAPLAFVTGGVANPISMRRSIKTMWE